MQSLETSHTPSIEEALDLALDRPTVLSYQYFKQFKTEILKFIKTHKIPAESIKSFVDAMGHSHYCSDENGLDIYIPSFDELSRAQKRERKASAQAGCALPERMLVKNAIERTLTQEDEAAEDMELWMNEWWGRYGDKVQIHEQATTSPYQDAVERALSNPPRRYDILNIAYFSHFPDEIYEELRTLGIPVEGIDEYIHALMVKHYQNKELNPNLEIPRFEYMEEKLRQVKRRNLRKETLISHEMAVNLAMDKLLPTKKRQASTKKKMKKWLEMVRPLALRFLINRGDEARRLWWENFAQENGY